MNLPKQIAQYAGLACCLGLWASVATAGQLVYVPENPDFGGNPANGPGLLASAEATNKHTASSDSSSSLLNQTPLEQFNQTLEQTVLSQLASAATSKLIGPNGQLTPGTFSTSTFNISIVDMGNGTLSITTTDKVNGTSTTFQVAQ